MIIGDLSAFLKDMTTGKNIIFATDAYTTATQTIDATTQMTVTLLHTGTLPFGKPEAEYRQMSFFDFATNNSSETDESMAIDCRIMDWDKKKAITYNSIKRG